MSKKRAPKVVVIVEARLGREILVGCLDYAERADWPGLLVGLHPLAERGQIELPPCDGVIAMIWSPTHARALRQLGCPIVNVAALSSTAPFVTVQSDDHAIGALAAQHLLDRGLRHFGAIHPRDQATGQRVDGFLDELARAGTHRREVALFRDDVVEDTDELASRLSKLQRPLGVFAYADYTALHLIRACGRAGLRVPNEVAIVGCDNMEGVVEQASPPLSSVALSWQRIGWLAAERLDALMRGDDDVPPLTLVPPTRVIMRDSSRLTAVDDPEVTHALQVMRTPEGMRQNIDELVAGLSLTRRTLERRFQQLVGRSPADELRRVRVERAKMLLTQSVLPMHEIAAELGFANANHFSVLFMRTTGMRPTRYRQLHADDPGRQG